MNLRKVIALLLVVTTWAFGKDDSLAGVYRSPTGIYVLTLTLLANGHYLAKWDTDVGSNGTASGSWRKEGSAVHLTPKKEDGKPMIGYLRVLLIRQLNGQEALIRKEDRRNEGNPFLYLYKQKGRTSRQSQRPAPSRRVLLR